MTMMFYDMSRQYHAERIRSVAEQRRLDDELGMRAARMGRAWRRLTGQLSRHDRGDGRGPGPGHLHALRARPVGQ